MEAGGEAPEAADEQSPAGEAGEPPPAPAAESEAGSADPSAASAEAQAKGDPAAGNKADAAEAGGGEGAGSAATENAGKEDPKAQEGEQAAAEEVPPLSFEELQAQEEERQALEAARVLEEAKKRKKERDAKRAEEEAQARAVRNAQLKVEQEEKARKKAEKAARSKAKEDARKKAAADSKQNTAEFQRMQAEKEAQMKREAAERAERQRRERELEMLAAQFERGKRKKSAIADYNFARDMGFITAGAVVLKGRALEGTKSERDAIKAGGVQTGVAGAGGDIDLLKDSDGKLIIRDDVLLKFEKKAKTSSKGPTGRAVPTSRRKSVMRLLRRGSNLAGVRVNSAQMQALKEQREYELEQEALALKSKRKRKLLGSFKMRMGTGGVVKSLRQKKFDEEAKLLEQEGAKEDAGYEGEDEDAVEGLEPGGEEQEEKGWWDDSDEDEGEEKEELGEGEDEDEEHQQQQAAVGSALQMAMVQAKARKARAKADEEDAEEEDAEEGEFEVGEEKRESDEDSATEEYSELGDDDKIGEWFDRDADYIHSLEHEELVDAMVALERAHHSCRLQVQIHSAIGLARTDLFGGKNDVYAIVYWMEREIGRTSVEQDTLEPEWAFEVFEMLLPSDISVGRLRIELFDDDFGKDDFLGEVTIQGAELLRIGMTRRTSHHWHLINEEGDKRGQAALPLKIQPDKKGSASMKYVKEGSTLSVSQGRWRKLQLHVLRAQGLTSTDGPLSGGGNDVYCLVFIAGKQVHKTKVIDNTLDAMWDDGSESVGVFMPEEGEKRDEMEVRIEVWDYDVGKDDFLGQVVLSGTEMCALLDGQKDEARERRRQKRQERRERAAAKAAAKKHMRGFGRSKSKVVDDDEDEEEEEEEDAGAHHELVKHFPLEKKKDVKAKKQKFVKAGSTLTLAWVDDTPSLGHDLQHRLHAVRHGFATLRQAGATRLGIQIHGCAGLAITDMGASTRSRADAYCLVYFDERQGNRSNFQLIGRSATIKDSLQPVYEGEYFEVELPVNVSTCRMVIEVWDHDVGRDDFLGMVELDGLELLGLPVEEVKTQAEQAEENERLRKEDERMHRGPEAAKAAEQEQAGTGQVALPLLKSKRETPTTRKLKASNMKHVQGSISLSRIPLQRVQVQVCGATDLPSTDWSLKKDGGGKRADAYAKVSFNEKELRRTHTVQNKDDPEWVDEVVTLLMPHQFDWAYTAKLKCVLWDDDGALGKDDYIGETILTHTELMAMGAKPGAPPQRFKLTLDKKQLKTNKARRRKPQGVLLLRRVYKPTVRFHILYASGLNKTDGHFGGLNDVYVVVMWNGREVGRTYVVNDTLNPVWQAQHFDLLLPEHTDWSDPDGKDGDDGGKRPGTGDKNTAAHKHQWNEAEVAGVLTLQVWDKDVDADDFLGEVTLGQEALAAGRPLHKQELTLSVDETMDRNKVKYVGGKLGVTWEDPIPADRRDEEAAAEAEAEQAKDKRTDEERAVAAAAEQESWKSEVDGRPGTGTVETQGLGAEVIPVDKYPRLGASEGGDKAGSGFIKCEELGLGEWGGGMGMDAQCKYLSVDGEEMTLSLRAAILVFHGEFAINPFEVKLTDRIRMLRDGDASDVIPWKDPMNPFPDGRLDWEYNHLYCDRHIPSRTVDGPAKETVMQAGPASNVKFKQNDYVLFHSKLLTPALKPRAEDFIDKNDTTSTAAGNNKFLPVPLPAEYETPQEYCGRVVGTPMHRQGVGFVSDYRVRWFRGVKLCPGTGLFKAVKDWEGGKNEQIGLYKYELVAAEAFSKAYDEWWAEEAEKAKKASVKRLPKKERLRKARRAIRDSRLNAINLDAPDKKTSSVEWVQSYLTRVGRKGDPIEDGEDFKPGTIEEDPDAGRGRRWFQPQQLSPRTKHKKYSALAEAMTGKLPDIEETKEDLQHKALVELGLANPVDRMLEVEKERVKFYINTGEGDGWREFSTRVTNMKVLLLREDELQTLPQAKNAKLRKLVCEWEQAFTRPCWGRWCDFVQRKNEFIRASKEEWAAAKVQGVVRGMKQRKLYEMTKEKLRARADRVAARYERQQARRQRRIDRERLRNEKAKSEKGFTLDGTMYFRTKAEMQEYYRQKRRAGKFAYVKLASRVYDLMWTAWAKWTQRTQDERDFAKATSHHPIPRDRLEALEARKHRAIERQYRKGVVVKTRFIRYDKLEYELPEGHPHATDQYTYDVRYADGVMEQGLRRHILRAYLHGVDLANGGEEAAEAHAELAATAANEVAAAVAQAAMLAADAANFAAVACMYRGAGIGAGAKKAVLLAAGSQEIFMQVQNRHRRTLSAGVAGDPHRKVPLGVGTKVEVDVKGGLPNKQGVREGRGIWHPVLDIQVPRYALCGAHGTPDGGVAITSFGVYTAFKEKMRGPTDWSNWVIKDRILVGAYPEGQARRNNKTVTSRSSSVMQILLSGVGCFCSLMEKHEMIRHRPGYRPDVIRKYNMLKAEYRNAFEATTLSLRMAEKSAKQAEKYGQEERNRVMVRLRKATLNWQESKQRLDAIPRCVDFIDFPMPTEGDIDEVECIKFIQAMESRLRPPPEPIDMASEEIYMIFKGRTDEVEERLVALRPKRFEWLMQWIKEHMAEFEGPILKQNDYEDADAYTGKNKVRNDFLEEDAVGRRIYDVLEQAKMLRKIRDVNSLKANDQDNLYIFSEEGHGRIGVIGGVLLGRIYGLTPAESVERIQRLHDIRPTMEGTPGHLRMSCPKTLEQRRQLISLLNHTRPMLSDIERRDDKDFSEMRSAAHGMGIPAKLQPKYKSPSIRVQAAMDGTPVELVRAHRGVGVPRTNYADYEKTTHDLYVLRNHLTKEEAAGRPQPELPVYREEKDYRKKRKKRVREWGEEHSSGDDPEDMFESENSDYGPSGHESSDSSDNEPMRIA